MNILDFPKMKAECRKISMVTCYEMVAGGLPAARAEVEKQVQELENLVEEGKLSKGAAEKAASVLAVQAEYMSFVEFAQKLEDPEGRDLSIRMGTADYDEGTMRAGPEASLAGKRLVELTINRLGYLAGPPKEGEGRPMPACYAPVAPEGVRSGND